MIFQQVDYGSPAFDELMDLRDTVLRRPLGMVFTPDQLSSESNDFHFGVYDNESLQLKATLLMKIVDRNTLKMRQVAVDPNFQGKGIGQFIVHEVETWSKHYGYNKIVLAARDVAVEFYKKLSYQITGKPFTEVGIPHRYMEKLLNR